MYPSVKCMQQRVPCPVSYTAASVSLAPFSILQALTAKSSLIDLSIFSTTERHAKVLQLGRTHKGPSDKNQAEFAVLDVEANCIMNGNQISYIRMYLEHIKPYLYYSLRSLLCHVMDSILVSQPIRSLHRIIEMPPPVIVLHVPQSGVDPTLQNKVMLKNVAKGFFHSHYERINSAASPVQLQCETWWGRAWWRKQCWSQPPTDQRLPWVLLLLLPPQQHQTHDPLLGTV